MSMTRIRATLTEDGATAAKKPFRFLVMNVTGPALAVIKGLGDPRLFVCQAPGALVRVSTCGSISGPFRVHFGSISGPFRVHFGDASFGFRVSMSIQTIISI